jgi:hypothetical protein
VKHNKIYKVESAGDESIIQEICRIDNIDAFIMGSINHDILPVDSEGFIRSNIELKVKIIYTENGELIYTCNTKYSYKLFRETIIREAATDQHRFIRTINGMLNRCVDEVVKRITNDIKKKFPQS